MAFFFIKEIKITFSFVMINIYSLFQKTIELRLLLNNCLGRVLMFHQIDERQNWKYFSITFSSFKKLIESLIETEHKFISLYDIETTNQLSANAIVLTFDDGYACLQDSVAQYLTDKKIPFAIFATVDFLNNPMYLTSEQLKRLSDNNLCTIGAHSLSHPLLRKLNDKKSKDEILISKSIIEEILVKEVNYFAYPYGSVYAVSNRDIKYAKESGYKLAFSTISACLSKQALKERCFLPRININELNYKKLLNYK